MNFLFVGLIAFSIFGFTISVPDKVVCYFESWAVYRQQSGSYDVENIDPFLCTHLIYAFIGISEDGSIRILDTWNEIDRQALLRFTDLTQENPDLKTLVAIGGYNEESPRFSTVFSNPSLRGIFVQNVANFLEQYNFDGFDVDWEYPNQRGGAPEDVENFVTVLRELRDEFNSRGGNWLLTAALGVSQATTDTSYNVREVLEYLDWGNLMAYDYHGDWDNVTGHVAPLYAKPGEDDPTFNVDWSINYWLERGAPPEKLVLGLATYGRSFSLANPDDHGIGAPVLGPGNEGPYTLTQGFLAYSELCQLSWTFEWDDDQEVPYAYNGEQWIGFESEQSIIIKTQYAIDHNLGGVMFWTLDDDDVYGLCGEEHPLISAARLTLGLEE